MPIEEATEYVNKYGVPHHRYSIFTAGKQVVVDIGVEEEWGDVQPCTPGDCDTWRESIGWGNDSDGHTPISAVADLGSGSVWSGPAAVRTWYNECVARYANRYAQ